MARIDAIPTLPALEVSLARIEQQFSAVSNAIVGGDCAELELASAGLRAVALDLSRLLESALVADPVRRALRMRVTVLATGLSFQRENLVRRLTSVERSLHSLVPNARHATYSPGAGPYGSSARRSGAFKTLAA